MAEHQEAMGPVATKLTLENEHIKIWEADVGPGEDFPLHHHAYDYVLFTTGVPALLELRDYGRPPSTVPVPAHAAIFIPAGGTESYGNVGRTRFTEVLVEIKRPRRPSGARRLCHLQCVGGTRSASRRRSSAGKFAGANRRNPAAPGQSTGMSNRPMMPRCLS